VSGFDKNWLALREPVDARSRDKALLAAAAETIESAPGSTILDVGCGTGATFRALAPKVERKVHWRLFDNDKRLLDEARRLHGNAVELIRCDLNNIEALPLTDARLVTASALFDLCSEQFIRRFAERISRTGIGLYAALNYDGEMTWSQPHPLDQAIAGSFNAHQLSDKGFGVSLGPAAWKTLVECLKERGYTLQVASSPWIMTAADAGLQRLFIDGVIRAIYEYGQLDEAEIRDWIKFRYRMIDQPDSLCRVGHQDILASR